MLTRLRPWQAAAALTGVLFAVQVILLLSAGDPTGADVEEPAALSPLPSEAALAAGFLLVVFAVLWWVFSLVARARLRRRRARGV